MWLFGERPVVIDMDSEVSGIKRVAAGDPTIGLVPIRGLKEIPDNLQIGLDETVSEYTLFEVMGSSMSPEGIANGDRLLCKKVSAEEAATIGKGVFAIIEVDPAYYKAKNKELKYGFKLRHTLYNMPEGMSFEDLKDSIKDITTSIALEKNRELLKSKYEEAVAFYKNRHLMLSLTYREGILRYSFHPVDLIKYKAVYILKHNDAGWYAKKL